MTPPILGIWASQISGHLYNGPYGAYDALATVTVPSGGAASITFAGIPTGYKHLQIRSLAKMTSTAASADDGYIIQVNGDTGSNYSWHMMYGIGSGSTYATGGTSTTRMYPYGLPFNANVGFGSMITDVLDYASVTKNKTFRFLSGYDNNGSGDILEASGAWYNSSNAITSITFTPPYGNFAQYSQFSLFGVK
jgi:hypothetical protein